MFYDQDGDVCEPCLSCPNIYVEDIWYSFMCKAKECIYEKNEKGNKKMNLENPNLPDNKEVEGKGKSKTLYLIPKANQQILIVCNEDFNTKLNDDNTITVSKTEPFSKAIDHIADEDKERFIKLLLENTGESITVHCE